MSKQAGAPAAGATGHPVFAEVAGLVDSWHAEVVVELGRLDADLVTLDALLISHCRVCASIAAGRGPITEPQLRFIVSSLAGSHELAQQIRRYRRDALTLVMAHRLGVAVDDRVLVKDLLLWSGVLAAATMAISDERGRPLPEVDEAPSREVPTRMYRVYEQITGRSAPAAART